MYPEVKKIKLTKGTGKNRKTIWEYPKETHAVLKKGGDKNNLNDWEICPEWKTWRNTGFRHKYAIRRPNGTAKKNGPPIFALYNGKRLDYIESRKKIYVPTYSKLLKQHPLFQKLITMLVEGNNIMLVDLDGPDVDKYPEGREITKDILDKLIDDPTRPYGHGYVAAGVLLRHLGLMQ